MATMLWNVAVLALLVSSASASSASFSTASRVEIERSPFTAAGRPAPRGWARTGRALVDSASDRVELSFALARAPEKLAELKTHFEAVSDPRSPRYGAHLTRGEAAALLKPVANAEAAVRRWLELEHTAPGGCLHASNSAVVEALGPARELLLVRVSAAEAGCLLRAKYAEFQHAQSGLRLLRAPSYTLPRELAPLVDFVGGVLHFPEPFRVRRTTQQVLVSPDGTKTVQRMPAAAVARALEFNDSATAGFGVTPRLVRDRYECSAAEGGKAPKNRQAAASFLGQYFDEVDLQEFYGLFMQEMVGRTPDKIIGSQGLIPGVEANLDVQYITSIGLYTSTWVYSTQGLHDNQEPFLKWMSLVANETDEAVPKSISISYGDSEDSISAAYKRRVDVEAQHLGSRGISLLFASGDSGASCQNDGQKFEPNFPVSSPSVTGVGGTTTNGFLESGPEVCNSLSGGGFSDFWPQPSYQKEAVAEFFKNSPHLPAKHFYNATGRGYPDVAALSAGFWVTYAGIPTPVAGTSCAAPSFGAVVGLLNEYRMEQKKPSLGFLNPLFYQLGAKHGKTAFHDVTRYCQSGCQANGGIGFCAVDGWDPTTGWVRWTSKRVIMHQSG
jgi:tripeptidyl-peptidase I